MQIERVWNFAQLFQQHNQKPNSFQILRSLLLSPSAARAPCSTQRITGQPPAGTSSGNMESIGT